MKNSSAQNAQNFIYIIMGGYLKNIISNFFGQNDKLWKMAFFMFFVIGAKRKLRHPNPPRYMLIHYRQWKILKKIKNFHCLWCPNMYLGGIWWYHFCFGPMTKNVKNAIFHIWLFWPKKMETIFSANLLIAIYNKFWAFWALEFLKNLKKWVFYKVRVENQ